MVKQNHLKTFWTIYSQKGKEKWNTLFHIAGDFNLNLLHHDKNRKVQRFLNISYKCMIPTMSKPNRVTWRITTAIDRILKNFFINTFFAAAIFKNDLYDNFHICFINALSSKQINNTKILLYIKECLAHNQLNCLNRGFLKQVGVTLKSFKTSMKCIKVFE